MVITCGLVNIHSLHVLAKYDVCIPLNIESAIHAFFHVLFNIYFRKATGCVLSLQRTNWKTLTNISQISLRYVLNPCHAVFLY